jgi:hypothetical protein
MMNERYRQAKAATKTQAAPHTGRLALAKVRRRMIDRTDEGNNE